MDTASGWARCSSPQPQASRSISSGVSLPSSAGTGSSLIPPTRSGAPFSSTLMWALAAHTTAPQRGSMDCSADVGAGAVEHRERLRAGPEVLGHHLLQPRRVRVLAVGDLVAPVGGGQRGEDLRVHPGVVVGGEAPHGRIVQRRRCRCGPGGGSAVVVIALLTLSV